MRVLLVCFLALGLIGCESKEQRTTQAQGLSAAQGSYDFALPADASNTTKTSVGKSEQVAFVVERKYPAFAFPDDVLARLKQAGWKTCPSPSDEWSSFVDSTSSPATRVHQKIIHIRNGDTVLVLAGRYVIPLPSGASIDIPVPPSTNEQMGNVLAFKGSANELEEVLKTFNARC